MTDKEFSKVFKQVIECGHEDQQDGREWSSLHRCMSYDLHLEAEWLFKENGHPDPWNAAKSMIRTGYMEREMQRKFRR